MGRVVEVHATNGGVGIRPARLGGMSKRPASEDLERAWDDRIRLLTTRLSPRTQNIVESDRKPGRWVARRALGVLFILGMVTSIPRNRGLWLLPIGITLVFDGISGWKARAESLTRTLDPTLNRVNPWWRRLQKPSSTQVVQPDDTWEIEQVKAGPNGTGRTFTRIRAAHIPPPWEKYPAIPLGSLAWRMGEGEEYMISFRDWLQARSPATQQSYARANPEPHGWQGFYGRMGIELP
jgi:hypothetical protein